MSEATAMASGDTKVLFVRLPRALHLRLKILAAEHDQPMAELARDAVREYLEREEGDNG